MRRWMQVVLGVRTLGGLVGCFHFRRKVLRHQSLGKLTVAFLAFAVLGVGCTKAHMSHNLLAPIDLASKDAVTVVLDQFSGEFSASKEAKFFDCVTEAIHKVHPTVRIITPDDFRHVAFPDVALDEILSADRSWEQMARDPAFRQQIAPLDVHYLITLSGETTEDAKLFTARSGAYSALIYGQDLGDRRSSLTATVINLKQGSVAGSFHAHAYNIMRTGWMILPLPLYVPSRTETRVCRELGKGVAALLAVEKPPGEIQAEQFKEKIREEWTRTKGEDQQGQFIGHGYGPNPFE